MKPVNFGIDLGTTNSLIGKYENGQVTLFKNPIGHKESLASVVAFRKDRILIGDKAREYVLKDPVNVFSHFKRRMGTDDRFYVVNQDENITPIELSAHILRELKQFVYTGESIGATIITIPASFDTMQANATKEAGKKAGFQEVFLLQEPIAASLAYFNNSKEEKNGFWLVYDLGGGTFDIALVEIKDGEMKVIDHEGNNFLGGVDFDSLIVEKIIIPKIIEETGVMDFSEQLTIKHGKYEKLYYQLLYLAEEVKKELSVQPESEIDISAEIEGKDYDFYFTIKVEEFNNLIAKKTDDTLKMIHSILNRNNLKNQSINEIILVGGSTFIPYIKQQLKEKTGIPVNSSIDPTTAIAVGASYYAANKYYEPKEPELKLENGNIDQLLEQIKSDPDFTAETEPDNITFSLTLGYNKMSKEDEEVLLVKAEGDYENYTYRIIRIDGGFDTGIRNLRSKFTEFLPLLPGILNSFKLRVFDSENREINTSIEDITITHGQYNIAGQPLPKDICIEIDDKENYTTKLEVIFEKNSILPLKKTLYREISKSIKHGSHDSIIINILEGDRFARTISNLPIGYIEISGKDLTSDLIKGSDIEIQISISDDRELSVFVYLVMTQQEFKNVFSISEKHINISRLKEQFRDLEIEIRKKLKEFNIDNNSVWAIHTQELMKELESYKDDLFSMKDNDSTDKRYVIAETIGKISQEFDKIGGYDRLEALQYDYIKKKEYTEEILASVNTNKEELTSRFHKIIEAENQILKSRNPAILQRNIELLDNLQWVILWNTNTHIISEFYYFKSLDPTFYNNYKVAQTFFVAGEKAIQEERFQELKRLINNLYTLSKFEKEYRTEENDNFKGTGIG